MIFPLSKIFLRLSFLNKNRTENKNDRKINRNQNNRSATVSESNKGCY